MKQAEKTAILVSYGCWGYPFLEYWFRGWSHWSMALAGGICFGLLGQISDLLQDYSLPVRCVAGTGGILCVEFIFGCIFNLGMHLHVWDYSGEWMNLAGQICVRYGILWLFLSAPLILLADQLKIQKKRDQTKQLPACKQRKMSI